MPLVVAAIGQSIMQALSPRNHMLPLQDFLAVHLHNRHGKRDIVDQLNAFGFCKSYSEVRMYLRNAAVTAEHSEMTTLLPDQDVQYMVDNVDWDRDTIDGRNTVHWTGQMTAVYPSEEISAQVIPRQQITR